MNDAVRPFSPTSSDSSLYFKLLQVKEQELQAELRSVQEQIEELKDAFTREPSEKKRKVEVLAEEQEGEEQIKRQKVENALLNYFPDTPGFSKKIEILVPNEEGEPYSFRVHLHVLASVSSIYQAMLDQEPRKKQQIIWTKPNGAFNPEAVAILLHYICCLNDINSDQKRLQLNFDYQDDKSIEIVDDILTLCDQHEMDAIRTTIEQLIQEQIFQDGTKAFANLVLFIIKLSDPHRQHLEDILVKVIKTYFSLKKEELTELSESIKRLLRIDSFSCFSLEEQQKIFILLEKIVKEILDDSCPFVSYCPNDLNMRYCLVFLFDLFPENVGMRNAGKRFLSGRDDLSSIVQKFPFLIANGVLEAIEGEKKEKASRLINILSENHDMKGFVSLFQAWNAGKLDHEEIIQSASLLIEEGQYKFFALRIRRSLFMRAGLYDKALADCNQSLNIRPKCVKNLISRAELHVLMKHLNLAVEDYDLAVKYSSNDPSVISRRGNFYVRNGNFDKALEDFNLLCQSLDSFSFTYWVERAKCYLAMNQTEKALEDLNALIEWASRLGDEDEWILFYALNRRADLFIKIERLDLAVKDFSEVLRANSAYSDARKGRATCYYQLGERELALADIEVFLKTHPDDQEAIAMKQSLEKKD